MSRQLPVAGCLRIAIPKGRLQADALRVFAAAGFTVPAEEELRSRKLVFRQPATGNRQPIEWIFVKDCDVPVYVEHGAADAGIAGLDQILEHECTAYQPLEFDFGRCRMMLIAAPGAPPLTKIATKYPRIARQFLDRRGVRAEIVPLGGSVELAAVLELTSHVIDLVETGETVRVHKLVEQELVAEISPRLIVGKSAFRTKTKQMRELIARIENVCHPERSERPGGAGGAEITIIAPPAHTDPSLTLGMTAVRVADEMIAGVRARGDAYVAEQLARFDRVTLAPDEIKVAPREVTAGAEIAAAVDLAIERVEAFHRPQLPQSYRWRGIEHRVRPLRRVACYVPGGRAVYLSTLIMTAVPARLAGVKEIVVITTPAAAERDELHYVSNKLGVREIYRCGGAAGIAAAALGTASLARVDKIVGPGNAYVTAAKMRLVGEVGIDMTAGPTELVVIADETADAALVQADLDAQAEHGADSVVTCISIGKALAVRATRSVVVQSADEAITLADDIAPEHVSIQARDAERIAARLENCGAIFCGPLSPVAAGDYIAGPNHVLPTGGTARFFSPLGVYDFVKRSNVIALDAEELAAIAACGERLATFEGLPKHAESLAIRRTTCLAAS